MTEQIIFEPKNIKIKKLFRLDSKERDELMPTIAKHFRID